MQWRTQCTPRGDVYATAFNLLNLATRQHDNLETWQIGKLVNWQLGNMGETLSNLRAYKICFLQLRDFHIFERLLKSLWFDRLKV